MDAAAAMHLAAVAVPVPGCWARLHESLSIAKGQ